MRIPFDVVIELCTMSYCQEENGFVCRPLPHPPKWASLMTAAQRWLAASALTLSAEMPERVVYGATMLRLSPKL